MSVIYEPKGRAREYSLLALNIFEGCRHGCTYCYAAMAAKRYGRDFSDVRVKNNLLARLARDVAKYSGTDKRVLLCFNCDPYQNDFLITRSVIELLALNNIPFHVLTKGGMLAARDFDLYGPDDAFATTMTFLKTENSTRYEPRAASPSERVMAIAQAKGKGIRTWISLEPVIDPRQSLDIIDWTHEFCDHYKIGKLNYVTNDTDWRRFAVEALARCRKYGKSYYIKEDLRPFLKGFEYENTDTRMI